MRFIAAEDRPFVPAAHENPDDPGVWKKVLLKRDDLINGRVQMFNWAKLPPGKTFAAHFHEDMLEIFIMLSGQAEIRVNDDTRTMAAGDTVVIDPREVHTMWNEGEQDAEYLAVGIATGEDGQTVLVDSRET